MTLAHLTFERLPDAMHTHEHEHERERLQSQRPGAESRPGALLDKYTLHSTVAPLCYFGAPPVPNI